MVILHGLDKDFKEEDVSMAARCEKSRERVFSDHAR